MNKVSNPSVAALTKVLVENLHQNGYSAFVADSTNLLARQLSHFMEQNALQDYNESVGVSFQDDYCRNHTGERQLIGVRLFITRINAILNGEGFVPRRKKLSTPDELPVGLESLLTLYKEHCTEKGNCPSTVHRYEMCCRPFLKLLADEGVCGSDGIITASISRACLKLTCHRSFPAIRAFLRFLADNGHLNRDYSFLIPRFKSPQKMPSVYSVNEIQKIEEEAGRSRSIGKRNYAMLLLVTRLGLRPSDIALMTFDKLDFQTGTIRLIQKKTSVPLELPMLPAIRNALLDYIQNTRGDSVSPYVFLSQQPPHPHVSTAVVSDCVRRSILAAGIDPKNRGVCARAMRSSLASSMVNDGIPYEVVRKTLGHRDKEAIRHYAKIDVEQLKLYTLEPPAATGHFAAVLSGRCQVK